MTEESGRGIWGLLPAMLARKGSRRGRPCPRARMALAYCSQDKPWPTTARTGPGPLQPGQAQAHYSQDRPRPNPRRTPEGILRAGSKPQTFL